MREEEMIEVERRLTAAAQATDDLVRGWDDPHAVTAATTTTSAASVPSDRSGEGPAPIVLADRRRTVKRVLYPLASAAAVAAVVVGAVALTRGGSTSKAPLADPGGSTPVSQVSQTSGPSTDATIAVNRATARARAALLADIPGVRDVNISPRVDGGYTITGAHYENGREVAIVSIVVSHAGSGATLRNPCVSTGVPGLGGAPGPGSVCTQIVRSRGSSVWIRKDGGATSLQPAKVWTLVQIHGGTKVRLTVDNNLDRGAQVLRKRLPWTIAQNDLVELVSSPNIQVATP